MSLRLLCASSASHCCLLVHPIFHRERSFADAYKAKTADPIPDTNPTFTITMSKTNYVVGDTITASEFRLQHPSSSPTAVQIRVWLEIPTNGTTYYDLAGWMAFIGESGATTASFMDPAQGPDIASYHASIGGESTLTAFLSRARLQSRQNWRIASTAAPVIAYLRQQLGL